MNLDYVNGLLFSCITIRRYQTGNPSSEGFLFWHIQERISFQATEAVGVATVCAKSDGPIIF